MPSLSVAPPEGVGNLLVAYDGRVSEGVTRSVVLPAEPDEVWSTLTTPEELSSWLGEVVELEAEPGGSLVVREGEGAVRRGMVEAAEPGRILSFRWRRLAGAGVSLEVGGASRVTFVLEADPAGTRLTVTEEPVPLATAGSGA